MTGKQLQQLADDYIRTLNTDRMAERHEILLKVNELSAKDAVYVATQIACSSTFNGSDGYKALASFSNRL